jgi:hypothetical protein
MADPQKIRDRNRSRSSILAQATSDMPLPAAPQAMAPGMRTAVPESSPWQAPDASQLEARPGLGARPRLIQNREIVASQPRPDADGAAASSAAAATPEKEKT